VYILGNIHTTVMCVITHTGSWDMWKYISVYIVWSIHIALMCIIKHSVTQ